MENKYSGQERRKFPRVSVGFIVLCKVNESMQLNILVGNTEMQAIMSNLSEEGMSIMTSYNVPKSTNVNFKFILVNDRALTEEGRVNTIEVKGEVCYSRFLKDRAYQLGIHFIDISDTDRNFIKEFIRWTPGK
ncbi:MAG: PilZ domain-containing protein [Candidatus Omnitrophota bacterium]